MKTLMFVSVLMLSNMALADNHGSKKGACAEDRAKFCAGVEKGKGRIAECLQKNESQLSEKCKKRVERRKQRKEKRQAELQAACGSDISSLCSGEERPVKCLRKNKEKVSEGCKSFLKSKKEQRKSRRAKRAGKKK